MLKQMKNAVRFDDAELDSSLYDRGRRVCSESRIIVSSLGDKQFAVVLGQQMQVQEYRS